MNTARRIFSLSKDNPGLQLVAGGATGRTARYRYAFKTLQMPGLEVENPAILIYDEEPQPECDGRTRLKMADPKDPESEPFAVRQYKCFGGADVFLGLSVLRKLHLYFAFDEKVLYATAVQP